MCDCLSNQENKANDQTYQREFGQQNFQIAAKKSKKYNSTNNQLGSKDKFQIFKPNQPIDLKKLQYQQKLQQIKKGNTHFVDPEFIHQNASLSSQKISKSIVWKRISELNQPVTNKQIVDLTFSSESLDHFNYDNTAIKNVLQLLTQKSILKNKTLFFKAVPQGIYAFQFKLKGQPTLVIIDDYLPTYRNNLIYSPPLQQNYYVPLLQKALAKAYGNYQQIPHQEYLLIDVISNMPHIQYQINKTKVQQLRQILSNPNYICVSKSQNYQGNIDTCYFSYFNIVTKNSSKISLKKSLQSTLIEELSENQYRQKFKFLHVWIMSNSINSTYFKINKVEQIFKIQIKQNNSQFLVTYQNDVECRIQFLLVSDQMEYIKGISVIKSKYNKLKISQLKYGIYYLYVSVNNKNTGLFSLFTQNNLVIKDIQIPQNFIDNFFHKYSLTKNRQLNIKLDSDSYISMRILCQELGMAYVEIITTKQYKNKLAIEFDVEKLKESGYEIMNLQFKNKKLVKNLYKGENNLLLKFLLNPTSNTPIHFPIPIKFEEFSVK